MTQTRSKLTFLDLAGELRNEIYDLYMIADASSDRGIECDIRMACKQIKIEHESRVGGEGIERHGKKWLQDLHDKWLPRITFQIAPFSKSRDIQHFKVALPPTRFNRDELHNGFIEQLLHQPLVDVHTVTIEVTQFITTMKVFPFSNAWSISERYRMLGPMVKAVSACLDSAKWQRPTAVLIRLNDAYSMFKRTAQRDLKFWRSRWIPRG